jgi:hypothetical protein
LPIAHSLIPTRKNTSECTIPEDEAIGVKRPLLVRPSGRADHGKRAVIVAEDREGSSTGPTEWLAVK